MLGKIESRRKGQQRIRWLCGITNSMDMNSRYIFNGKLQEMVRVREGWHATVHEVTESDTTWWLNNSNNFTCYWCISVSALLGISYSFSFLLVGMLCRALLFFPPLPPVSSKEYSTSHPDVGLDGSHHQTSDLLSSSLTWVGTNSDTSPDPERRAHHRLNCPKHLHQTTKEYAGKDTITPEARGGSRQTKNLCVRS